MYGYIYLTTNLINGKKYIGKHKASVFESNKYIGSGKVLKNDIKAHNYNRKTDFSVIMLESCDTLEELNEREIYWIKYYNALEDDMFYNIHFGGDGGDIGLYLPPERMKEIRKNHSQYMKDRMKTDSQFKKRFSGAKDNHIVTESTKIKIKNTQKNYWDNVDETVKHERLSNVATKRNLGRVWITNDIIDKFVVKEDLDTYLNSGFKIGRKFKTRNHKITK